MVFCLYTEVHLICASVGVKSGKYGVVYVHSGS